MFALNFLLPGLGFRHSGTKHRLKMAASSRSCNDVGFFCSLFPRALSSALCDDHLSSQPAGTCSLHRSSRVVSANRGRS